MIIDKSIFVLLFLFNLNMKKQYFYLLVAIMLIGNTAMAQLISIGTESITTTGLPIDPFYQYSYSQQIYLASEINTSGDISQLSFKVAENRELNNSNEWIVYLSHTTKTNFDSTTDWVASTELTQVYSGTFTHSPGADVVITLNSSFNYNGIDNLIIAIEDNSSSYDSGSDDLLASSVTGNRAIMYRSDSVNPDPTTPPTATNIQSYIANVDINFGNINPCDTARMTINNTFESYPAGTGQPLPECWTSIAPTGMVIGNRNTAGEAYSGTNYISAYVSVFNNQDGYIISPKLSSINGNYEADFFIKTSYPGATFQYGTMSDPTDVSTFNAIGSETSLSIAYTNINTGSIPNTSDEYFVIKFTSPDQHTVIRMDDFKWQETVIPAPDNDACVDAIVTNNFPYTDSLNAVSATNNDGFITACSNGMNDGVWYTFTPTQDQDFNINLQVTSAWDAELAVFSGDCNNLTCVERSDSGGTNGDEQIIKTFTAGTQYWVNVGHFSSSSDFSEGEFTITISSLNVPENDACADAIVVNNTPYTHSMDATGATNNDGFISCNGTAMNDGVWYTYTTGATAEVIDITTNDGSNWDMALGVYKGADCTNLECVIQEDASSANFGEDITDLSIEANTTYWINVGYASNSSDGNEGNFTININSESLSTNTFELNNTLVMYPNPSEDGMITIKLNNASDLEGASVIVYNLTGKVVYKSILDTTNTLDLSHIQSGMYLVNVNTSKSTITKKLVIK